MLSIIDQIELEIRKRISDDEYESWMRKPNKKLKFRTPAELLSVGEHQPLWELIFSIKPIGNM